MYTDKIIKAIGYKTLVHAIVERTFENGTKTYATAVAKRGEVVVAGRFGFSLKQVERTLRVHYESNGILYCSAPF